MSQLVLTRMTIVEFEFSLIVKNHEKNNEQQFLLTGIKYIYWIRSYVLDTWVCLGIFWYMNSDCFRFQVPGLVVFLFGQWVLCRGKFYVGGRLWVSGVAGLWGGGPGDEGTSWSQKLWGLDRSNRIFASIQKLPGLTVRIHGLTLPKFGYKTQTPAEVGIFGNVAVAILREILWGFNWNHLGSEPLGGS